MMRELLCDDEISGGVVRSINRITYTPLTPLSEESAKSRPSMHLNKGGTRDLSNRLSLMLLLPQNFAFTRRSLRWVCDGS